jgi:hypothetical protein
VACSDFHKTRIVGIEVKFVSTHDRRVIVVFGIAVQESLSRKDGLDRRNQIELSP